MLDTCPDCKKLRDWLGKRDRQGKPFFRRKKRGEPGFCRHLRPLRINVYFPPGGVL